MDFNELLPDLIFQTVIEQGFRPVGTLLPLNSYENRVYEIALEDHEPIIAKYYRPGRWSLESIAEEHRFLQTLHEAEIPVVIPLRLGKTVSSCSTLSQVQEIPYAFYPKFRGREKDEIRQEDLRWLGRLLARLHNVGEHFKAKHRLVLNPQTYGYESLNFILAQPFLPVDIRENLEAYLKQALKLVEPFFSRPLPNIALHGDCHRGNILWNAEGPHLLDFDDMVLAPPVQDVWMLFSGDVEEQREQRKIFFEGYEMFREFDDFSLRLAEPLRTLRMIRHSAWIGQRHSEPLFQRAFPYYRERRYWEEFLLSMKEQISLLQELAY